MFHPTPRRFRKVNRHAFRSTYEQKSNRLRFGTHGLQALEFGFLTTQQLETIRRTLTSRLKRKGKVWLRALPDYPRTSKPKEVRRGRGKGAVSHWVAVLKPGRILVEVAASPRELPHLQEALNLALRKLPVFGQIVTRRL
jgi:large subunit ribosomal protein L16